MNMKLTCRIVTCLATLLAWGLVPALSAEPQTVTQPYRGVTYIDYRGTSPRRVHMHIVQIDLTTPGIRFLVTPYNPNGGKATMKETTLQFLNAHKREGAGSPSTPISSSLGRHRRRIPGRRTWWG